LHCRSYALAMMALYCTGLAMAQTVPSADRVAAPCTLEPGGQHTVARILDAETVQLDDGSSVRLIGALAPRAGDAGAAPGTWPAESEAIRTLSELVVGRTVKIAYDGRRRDRYGRHLAHLFLNTADGEIWVQGELLSAGVARAYGVPGNFACAAELLAHENLARTARRGLWGTGFYRPKPARLTALLMSRRSRFEIVEGSVVSASRNASGLYLNFGSDIKTDFTARIGKDVLAAHGEWDKSLSDLAGAGKAVTVRGWIERRGGPMIDIRDPSQLGFDTAPGSNPAVSSLPQPKGTENANTPAPVVTGPVVTGPVVTGPLVTGPLVTGDEPEDTPNANRPAGPLQGSPGGVDL
jgi:micrococcal nuclease